MAETKLRLPTQEEVELAISVGKIIVPTIKFLKGRFRKKSVEIRLSYDAVFVFYKPISIEDYHTMFVSIVSESKKDKRTLEIDGHSVNYFLSPNIKVAPLIPLEAEYGDVFLEEREELLSMSTGIDQIRLFIFPLQGTEMSPDSLESFAKSFDNFVERMEMHIRKEKRLPLNLVVKHLILESEDVEFLGNASKSTSNEGFRINGNNRKIMVTYNKLEDLLTFIGRMW